MRMVMRPATPVLVAALTAAALGLMAPRAAAEDRSVVKLDSKTIEADITINDDLKPYPALYDNLLAEAKRAAAKWRADADKDRRETPEIFRDGRRYSYERGYTRRSAIGRYVSVLRSDFIDGLGAHPDRESDTILWDNTAKKRVSIRPFFKETADDGPTMQTLAKAIRAALVVEKKARDVPEAEKDSGLDAVKPKILSIGAIALAPSTVADKSGGLIAYFSPYAVGPYVEGEYIVFVPWTTFKDHLSAEGAALFGGERPKEDADKD
jgi:hypothetical protein